MLSTLDLPEMTPVLSSSVISSLSLGESLQPGLEGPRDAVKISVGTFPPLEEPESLGVEQSISVSAAQSPFLGVEQSVSVSAAQSSFLGVEQSVPVSAAQFTSIGVVQSVAEVAPSVGTPDINRTTSPTPGAGEVLIPSFERQGIQEPPDEGSLSDFELVPPTGKILTPGQGSETDLTCGQRMPSTCSSSSQNFF